MADKRATPEAPQQPPQETLKDAQPEPPRGQRAAPTIDLTAAEVPPPGEADAAAAGKRAGSSIRSLGIAAVVGAVVVLAVLVGLWRGGVLPIGNAGSGGLGEKVAALEKQIGELQARPPSPANGNVEALAQRVDKIEAALARLPTGDANVADKLAAADKAMKALGLALTALSRRTDDAAANAADARKAADAAAKGVADLQTSVAAAAASGSVPHVEFEALQSRVAALATQARAAGDTLARNSGNDSAARLALSAEVLRSAVSVGAPYADELAAVKRLGGDDKALAPLTPFAESGVPTAQALAHELSALIPQLQKIAGAPAPPADFLAKLQANAERLVRIRPLNAPQGNDPSTVLARIEVDAANADVAAMLADLARLPDDARAPAAAWTAKANARAAAIAAASQYAAKTARALAPQ